jgi:hypothetical protein
MCTAQRFRFEQKNVTDRPAFSSFARTRANVFSVYTCFSFVLVIPRYDLDYEM